MSVYWIKSPTARDIWEEVSYLQDIFGMKSLSARDIYEMKSPTTRDIWDEIPHLHQFVALF